MKQWKQEVGQTCWALLWNKLLQLEGKGTLRKVNKSCLRDGSVDKDTDCQIWQTADVYARKSSQHNKAMVKSNKSSCSTGEKNFRIKSAKLTNSNNTETNTICHFLGWQDTALWSAYQTIPWRKVKLWIPSNILKRKVRELTEFRVVSTVHMWKPGMATVHSCSLWWRWS